MTTNPADILKEIERDKARLRQEAEALARKEAEVTQLLELAAKYKMDLTPTELAGSHAPETLGGLIQVYKASKKFKDLSHASRSHYDMLLTGIDAEYGTESLALLGAESFEAWNAKWSDDGKSTMGRTKMKMVRIVVGFGTGVLHDRECERLFGVLSKIKLKFATPKKRVEYLNAWQATLIRNRAFDLKRPSIALAQAFQWDVGLLQKDTIGEWVPLDEDGVSDITSGSLKWMRGIRWNEIDDNMILRHEGDGWEGIVEADLRKAPMVLDELKRQFDFTVDRNPRFSLPASGPIIVSEYDHLPWDAIEFRRWWRKVADECEIPKGVRNSDSRARSKHGLQEASEDETKARLA